MSGFECRSINYFGKFVKKVSFLFMVKREINMGPLIPWFRLPVTDPGFSSFEQKPIIW